MSIKIKQHDITDCGAACLSSVASHYGLKIPLAKIRQIAGTDKKGTNLFGMMKASQELGFSAKGVRSDMKEITKVPTPSIAHIITRQKVHHYVVIYKTTEHYVVVMDPAIGKMKKIPFPEWVKLWTGVLLILAPDQSFEKGNLKSSIWKRFWFLVKPHRKLLIQAILGAMVYTILGLSTSIYIQKITDFVLVNGNTKLLNLLSLIMIGFLLIQIFIGVFKSLLIVKTGLKIDAHLILGYYNHLMKLPQRFFDNMRVGELLSRIGDAVKIRAFINEFAVNLFVNIFVIIFSFLLMFSYYWKLALVITFIIPFYLVVYSITNWLNKRCERKIMEKSADLESQLVESIGQMRTIKQLNLEYINSLKTENNFISLLNTTYRSSLNSLFSGNAAELTNRAFTIILLWLGSYYVVQQIITPGELLSFYAIIGYFTGPASSLIGMNKVYQNAMIAADRLFEIIDLDQEENQPKLELSPISVGDIHFKEVSFSYGTRKNVFDQLSLMIPKGAFTAIVGESGSGKSTIASLLQKLYSIKDGKIFIGNYDLELVSSKSLRRIIGIVPQQLELFSGSIMENIAIGDPEPDIKRVIDICSELGINHFIEELPAGIHTHLDENGKNLSTGQKQRLAIARAIYRNPEILILDEATSALDSNSEQYVQQFIQRYLTKGKTLIVIAHRLSTIEKADKIIVLAKGKIAEQGNHNNLLIRKGIYHRLWTNQHNSTPIINEVISA